MKFKKNKGLTLLEVIISLAILGIIIIPILSMTLTTVKISKSSEEKILATSLAQQCTEYIKSEDINNLNLADVMESQIGLKKILRSDVSDNENIEKIKAIFKDDVDIGQCYLYNGKDKLKYKNLITKINYKIDAEIPTDVYSDKGNYDIIITVDEDNKITMMDTNGNDVMPVLENKMFNVNNGRATIEIINNANDITCNIKQGNIDLISGAKVPRRINTPGNVKFVIKGDDNISVDIYAKNIGSSNGKLDLKVLKTSNSKYACTIIENDGANSDNISEQYETFDVKYKDPNKLMKIYLVNIEVWYYDINNNTKTIMQQVKTYKTL